MHDNASSVKQAGSATKSAGNARPAILRRRRYLWWWPDANNCFRHSGTCAAGNRNLVAV